MLKNFLILFTLAFLLSCCGTSSQTQGPNHTDQRLEQIRRQRDEIMKKSDQVNCQSNRGSRECLGVY